MSIEVRNLSYTYSKNQPDQHQALKNISFKVEDGEIIGIVGHTGSGKSTLLQQLNGLLHPDEGSVLVDGEELKAGGKDLSRLRQKVGLVFQYPEYQLFEETVEKDVAYGPGNQGLSQEEIAERVREAIGLTGLCYEQVAGKSPFELSGGQKRRVAIAGVIAMQPRVLILDEPTAGLDPGAHREIIGMIRRIHQEKPQGIIIFVSHNMADVAELSDRVMVIDRGELLMMDRPEEVFAHHELLRSVGLDLPPVKSLLLDLEAAGLPLDTRPLAEEEAAESIYEGLKGAKRI